MNDPLIGSSRANYIYFYCASLTSICNFFILVYIFIYILYLSNDINNLMINANDLISKINNEIPYLKTLIVNKIEEVCKFPNITDYRLNNLIPN